MRLDCLFIQREERYAGEYGPELLVAVDEFTQDQNPEWFEEESAKALGRVDCGALATTKKALPGICTVCGTNCWRSPPIHPPRKAGE